jgi:Mg-chelatase subunit ChlD
MANRLRIARLDPAPYRPLADAAPDAALHRRLDALIRRHLPAVTASVLAQPAPTADGRFVEWYSDLAGQPVAFAALADEAQAEARALLADRLNSIAGLAERLARIDPANAALADALRQAASYPGEETVYVVGDQPVLTFWGHRPIAAPEPPPPPAEPAAARRGLPRWLWALSALLLLALLGFGLMRYLDLPWPPWGPDYPKLLQAAKDEEDALSRRRAELEAQLADALARCAAGRALSAARAEEERLQKALAELAARLQDDLALCPLKQQLRTAVEQGKDLDRRTDKLTADLKKAIDACRRKEEEAKKKAEEEQKKAEAARRKAEEQQRKAEQAKRRAEEAARRQPVPPPAAIPPAESPLPAETPTAQPPPAKTETPPLPPCPGERTPEQAPDVAVVLDASGSMGLPASASAAEIQKHLRSLGGIIGLGAALLGGATSGPSRLDEAKKGVTNVVRSLPGDVDVGLVTLQRCPQATSHGFFSGGERGALYGKVAGLRPMQGTPLAQGLTEAAEMIDGVKAPAVMVVISDGEDSCGGDPCSTARRLKAAKPQLKINVVDITGDGAANCLATATGGRVLKPEDGLAFEKTIKQATQEALKPPHCP